MADALVRLESEGCVARIRLCRAEKRNALNINLLEQFKELLDEISHNEALRCLILHSEGASFCTGLDLTEAQDESLAEKSSTLLAHIFQNLWSLPMATIAAAQGSTLAGGAGLLMACDYAIASEDFTLAFPETQRGLIPALVSVLARHRFNGAITKRMMLFGETFDATTAHSLAIVAQVVPKTELMATAHKQAALLQKAAPQALKLTKNLLQQPSLGSINEELLRAQEFHLLARHGSEARQGLAAFANKCPPPWDEEKKL